MPNQDTTAPDTQARARLRERPKMLMRAADSAERLCVGCESADVPEKCTHCWAAEIFREDADLLLSLLDRVDSLEREFHKRVCERNRTTSTLCGICATLDSPNEEGTES